MSNTLSQNPDIISLDRNDPSVWSFPNTADLDPENPATQAREEYEHGLYVEAIANETAAEQVNDYETVPTAGEMHAYATNEGQPIDPALSEAVLAHAAATVNPTSADPVVAEAQAGVNNAFETQRMNREHHEAAVRQANMYAPQLSDMRDRALDEWGANA